MNIPQPKAPGNARWPLCLPPPSKQYHLQAPWDPKVCISPWGGGLAKKALTLGIMAITPAWSPGCRNPKMLTWLGPVTGRGYTGQSGDSGARVVTLPSQARGWAHQLQETQPSGSDAKSRQTGNSKEKAGNTEPQHGGHTPSPPPAQAPTPPSLREEGARLRSISLGKADQRRPLVGANYSSHTCYMCWAL